MTKTADTPLAWIDAIADVKDGANRRRAADAAERAAVAHALDVPAVARLEMSYSVHVVDDGDAYVVDGVIEADLTQTCVVTLEPLDVQLKEPFSVTFARGAEVVATPKVGEIDPDADPEPEPIVADGLAIGRVVVEWLAGAIDPYPRKPGATFDWQDPQLKDEGDARVSPFAVLARLKGRDKDGG